MENPEMQYQEYKEPINYIQSIIFALIGGLVGVAVWLAPVYFFDYILFMTVIFVGIFAALGAKAFNVRRGNMVIALIAIVATVIAIFIGDLAETFIIAPNFEIRLDNYLDYLQLKFSEDPRQVFYYIGAIGVAGFLGFTQNNK